MESEEAGVAEEGAGATAAEQEVLSDFFSLLFFLFPRFFHNCQVLAPPDSSFQTLKAFVVVVVVVVVFTLSRGGGTKTKREKKQFERKNKKEFQFFWLFESEASEPPIPSELFLRRRKTQFVRRQKRER